MAHTTLRTGRALLVSPGRNDPALQDQGVQNFRSEDLPIIDVLQPSREGPGKGAHADFVVFFEQSYEGERRPGFAAIRRILRHLAYGRMPDKLGEIWRPSSATWIRCAGALCPRLPRQHYRLFADTLFLGTGPQSGQPDHAGGRARRARPEQDGAGLAAGRLDKHTILRTQELLARQFGALGLGRIQVEFEDQSDPWPSGVNSRPTTWARPACTGTPDAAWSTRTAASTEIENLYVAGGSSAFPRPRALRW